MTIILNTLEEGAVSGQISTLINGDMEVINTSEMKISHCMGCNLCWLKTPGICAIKDDQEFLEEWSRRVASNMAGQSLGVIHIKEGELCM